MQQKHTAIQYNLGIHLHLRDWLFLSLDLPCDCATGSVFYMPYYSELLGSVDSARPKEYTLHLQRRGSLSQRQLQERLERFK